MKMLVFAASRVASSFMASCNDCVDRLELFPKNISECRAMTPRVSMCVCVHSTGQIYIYKNNYAVIYISKIKLKTGIYIYVYINNYAFIYI